jgi:hypothetical protein
MTRTAPKHVEVKENALMPSNPSPDFFRLLLDVESKIDSSHLDRFMASRHDRTVDYWSVERPGRLTRSWDEGAPVRERITSAEFLERTGVAGLFDDGGDITAVQSAVINPWGFVGYQFGEPLLIDLGYYRPVTETVAVEGVEAILPSYYASQLPDSTWRHGNRSQVFDDEFCRQRRVGTDVNTWRGTFTGKDGVHSFDDLRTSAGQTAVLRTSLRRSAAVIERLLARTGDSLWTQRDGRTAASLLAAAHLGGSWSVVQYLKSGAEHADEAGTSIAAYLKEFAAVPLTEDELR